MRKTSLLQAVNLALCIAFSKIILVICFVIYSYLGNRLTSEKVFVSLALFNHLRLCMTFFFANGISQLAESRASIRRLQTFLLLEDQEEMDTVERQPERPALSLCSVIVERVSARWDCMVDNLTLSDVSARVRAGELLAVVGPVGSGKTSLLMALLGELQAEKGRVAVSGSLAYTSQEPWTFAGTVRQNIVFDQAFDVPKYRRVLHACALDKDMEQFPQGDLTMVGDRGVSLSGGQRARVSLARAVYADSDIYLLDDPLSAVDSAVAKHLFESCICGYLRDKVRLLVTHQVQFLKSANNILVLDEGKMVALGSFTALVRLGVDLLTLEEDVIEERRNSVIGRPRRGSIMTRRMSVSQKRKMSVVGPSLPDSSEGRRKSVIMSGFRKSEKRLPGSRDQIIQPEARKPSLVASLFQKRKSSAGKSIGDRKLSVMSTASGEELFASAAKVTTEISPFGGIVETFVDYELLEDGKQTSGAVEETSASGSVDFAVYWKYFRSGGNTLYVLLFFVALLVRQIGINGSDYWLTLWSNENECLNLRAKDPNATCDRTLESLTDFLRGLGVWYEGFLRDGYAWLVGAVLLLSLVVSVMFSVLSMGASINLHKWMFGSVLRSKIGFFDDNPVGRILNRFSKDIGIVDEILPITVSDVLAIILSLSGSVILVIIVNPWIAIPTAFLSLIFLFLRGTFVAATRDVKRIEAITRSPVYSTLATAMHGITVIRAFRSQSIFEKRFFAAQDGHTAVWFVFICVSQFFGMVLDLLCGLYITAIAWVLVLLPLDSSGGNIGLAISSALVLSGTFQFGVRLSVEVENQMTSVERVLEYSKLEPEASEESFPDKKPPETWPQKGSVNFSGVYLKYTPEGNQILKDFNCHIQPEEKVGIVGRTGAGKSSLMLALYRMIEPEGIIYIDGLSTKDIGLHDLRSKISIIPQEPLIFTGTVKRNLDPFDEHPDPEIWTALEQVHLKGVVRNLPEGLSCELSEGGGQLSLGQRQLFCLARAILKKNKILVMDEATANIDHKTDALIQTLIKEVFRDCTVLTIAHRLNTIIDYNKILVLDSGVAAEFEEPHLLLQNPNGIFSEMARQTGWAMLRELQASALRSYRLRHPQDHRSSIASGGSRRGTIKGEDEDDDDVTMERFAFPEKTSDFKHAAVDRILSNMSMSHGIQDGDNIQEEDEDEEDSDDVTKDDGGNVTRL